ncbi:MAG: hypothetical protein RQ833_01055 [Sphingomonadaceae bacterium]|nr:hypothetical protein [Sphingomonadaceae bacterium]
MEQRDDPAQRSTFEFNRPTMVALLHLVSVPTGVTVLIGLPLACVWKHEAIEDWMRSH